MKTTVTTQPPKGATAMTKKESKESEKFLATGAAGDPNHPEEGAPAGAPVFDEDFAPVTEVETDAKKKDKESDK